MLLCVLRHVKVGWRPNIHRVSCILHWLLHDGAFLLYLPIEYIFSILGWSCYHSLHFCDHIFCDDRDRPENKNRSSQLTQTQENCRLNSKSHASHNQGRKILQNFLDLTRTPGNYDGWTWTVSRSIAAVGRRDLQVVLARTGADAAHITTWLHNIFQRSDAKRSRHCWPNCSHIDFT